MRYRALLAWPATGESAIPAPTGASVIIGGMTCAFTGETIQGLRRRWRVRAATPEAAELGDAMDVPSLVGQLLWQRGVRDADAGRQFLAPKLTDLHDPKNLAGVDKAAKRLADALRHEETVAIYGDYDVDGVTGLAILYHMLKAAKNEAEILRYVPHRVDEGYGVNAEAVAKLADAGAKVIVTVDCGITACEPAKAAAERGVDLIITDHHEMADALPEAYCLVHPRLENDDGGTYPFADLCGAGVALKLAWHFARVWCGSDRVAEVFRELLIDLLPLAALGTVADVTPLVGENRIITTFGLQRIKRTRFPGLSALIDTADLRSEKVDSYHVGFVLGPRLNACGRMGHAKEAVKLLTDAKGEDARQIALMLNRENENRRATEKEILQQARRMVADGGYDQPDSPVIVLGHEDWHPGVIGIVCSRLVDLYHRPVVLLNTANGMATGSARSIPGFNICQALAACAEHLETFGGHAMAGGLKLRPENLDAFRDALADCARAELTEDDLTPGLDLDAEVTLDHVSQSVGETLERLEPFGCGNPTPTLLVRGVTLDREPETVGREGAHLVVLLKQGERMIRCIAWRQGELVGQLTPGQSLDIACQIKLNRWKDRVRVEAVIEDMRIG